MEEPLHRWIEVQFSYGGWIECLCGFRPRSQKDMDDHIRFKVSIRRAKKAKRKRWWIMCPLCNFRSHCNQHNWPGAVKIAFGHADGKRHKNKLKQFQRSQQVYQGEIR